MNNKQFKIEANQYFDDLDFEYCEKTIDTLTNIFSNDIEIQAILKDLEREIIRYYK